MIRVDKINDAWMKLFSMITSSDGTFMHTIVVKEEDFVLESAGLLTFKSDDPVVKVESSDLETS